MRTLLFLAFCVFAFVTAQDDPEVCGYPQQVSEPVTFPSGHVCSYLNGQAGDKFFWDDGWGDETDELQDIADFISNQTKVYRDRLTQLGSNAPSCSQCAEWYNRYLCLASTPTAGASNCLFKNYWAGLRATGQCNAECSANATGLNNCNPNTQCCWCAYDNITAQCNSTWENYVPADSLLNPCYGVPVDYCQQTFSVCLGLPATDSKIVSACSFFTGGNNRVSWNNPPRFNNTGACVNDFTVLFDVVRMNGTGIPVLVPKNCTPVRVTTETRRPCNRPIRACRARTVNVKPYYKCQVNSPATILSFAASFLVAAASFALFL